MNRARRSEAGFALIESIAVLLLSALVMLTLLIATDLVSRNARAATQRANAIEGVATGLAALRRDISGAQFVRGGEGKPEDILLFEGGPRALSFLGKEPGGEDVMIRIETRYDARRGALIRSSAPPGPAPDSFAGASFGSSVILLSGPWTYRLSYGTAKPSGGVAWQDTWSSNKALPDAVRLEVLTGDGGQPAFTPLTVALRINAEVACPPDDETCGPEGDPGAEEDDENVDE